MFSGLIQYIGTIAANKGNRLTIKSVPLKAKLGDSISVNGVCLTVINVKKGQLSFDISEETVAKSTIGQWKAGKKVNIEPALRASDTLGGHLVQGHVDGMGWVLEIADEMKSKVIWFSGPVTVLDVTAPKGSIAVDGVSLTVVDVIKDKFSVAVVPFTWEHTTLGLLKKGELVNLESDVIGKYVAMQVARYMKDK